ncbi:MAG: EAL domain-containing protein [Aquificae bacterium]|nr:EAL domain-containing protein [Aquificota bacterium]
MPLLIHYSGLDKQSFLDYLKEKGFTVKPFAAGLHLVDYPGERKESLLDRFAELDKHFLRHLRLAFVPDEGFLNHRDNLIRTLLNLKTFDKLVEEFTVYQRDEILKSLYPVFQPIVDLKGFEIYAFEALCRGKLPIYYLMKFAKPILETIDWTCREKALQKKKEEIPPPIKIFLNFFPESLQNVRLASEKLFSLLNKYKISPKEVVVEITEYSGFDVQKLKELVQEWRKLGIMIALDDVGRGEDSLFRFLEIMPDIIKIDMVFIRGIHKNKVKRDITRYLINLAHANDMLVVAEGIEEPDELRVVYELGADLAQGWLLGKPTEHPRVYLHTPIASRLRYWI